MTWIGDRIRARENGRRAAWVAGSYLVVVATTAAATEYVSLTRGAPIGPGLALTVVTLPASLVPNALVWAGPLDGVLDGGALTAVEAGCGLLQAWTLWLLLRGPRRAL
ncbi:hypothetical protein GCM10010149_81380 [Nonomuraea roseoviolacea subsp. roseoviolacea]|uniref:SCO4225 family membrane protein n=1 Tax=Nonomuraea roseoviolacea TaxID=103837 RepID=UPI0031DE49D9